MEDKKQLATEVRIAAQDNSFELDIREHGELTPFTCPDCHGVLFQLKDGNRPRYRCHTGRAFSSDSLFEHRQRENRGHPLERSAWDSGKHNAPESHGRELFRDKPYGYRVDFLSKAREAQQRVDAMREVLLDHERLSNDLLRDIAVDRATPPKKAPWQDERFLAPLKDRRGACVSRTRW